MFENGHQRSFSYIGHKGNMPLSITGNLRGKAKRHVCQSLKGSPKSRQTTSDLTVIKDPKLREKAAQVSTKYQLGKQFLEVKESITQNMNCMNVKPCIRIFAQQNKTSGIQYLMDKSPFQKIKKREFVPASAWYPAKLNNRSRKQVKSDRGNQNQQSIHSHPTTGKSRISTPKQNSSTQSGSNNNSRIQRRSFQYPQGLQQQNLRSSFLLG